MNDPLVTTYSLILAGAFQVALLDAALRLRRGGRSPAVLASLELCAAAGGIIGARSLWITEEGLWTSGNILLTRLKSGYSSLGGIAAATVICAVYLWRRTSAPLNHIDAVTPSVAIGVAVAKIGCWLNGCCFGAPDSSILSIQYSAGTPAFAVVGCQPVFPLQLVMSLAAIAAYLLTAWLYENRSCQGSLFGVFLVSFGILRFLAYHMWGTLSARPFLLTPQGISIMAVVCGAVWMALVKMLRTGCDLLPSDVS